MQSRSISFRAVAHHIPNGWNWPLFLHSSKIKVNEIEPVVEKLVRLFRRKGSSYSDMMWLMSWNWWIYIVRGIFPGRTDASYTFEFLFFIGLSSFFFWKATHSSFDSAVQKTPRVSASVNLVPCSCSQMACVAYNSVLTLSALTARYPFCENNPTKKLDTLVVNEAGSSLATGGLILHIIL